MQVPDRSPVTFIHPDKISRGQGLSNRLRHLPSGHTLLVGEHANDALARDRSVSYSERPDYRRGREDSANYIQFADLSLYDNDADKVVSHQPVAVKFLKSEELVGREYHMSVTVNQTEGQVKTFRPLGFVRQGREVALISQFEEGVTSCDNLLWKEAPRTNDIPLALGVAAQSLIALHDQSIVHGDLQVKNTAHTVTLEPKIIDLTTAVRRHDPECFLEDISTYVDSLTRFGQRPSPVNAADVRNHLLDPYYAAINDIYPALVRRRIREGLGVLAYTLTALLR